MIFDGAVEMKRTESTDEAVQSNDQVLASGHGTGLDETLTMHQRRRRLVRGAAALAPLVLTLRSGALAAASCTGVKIEQAYVQGDNDAIPGKINGSIEPGDVCVPPLQLQACSDVPGKVVTSTPSAYAHVQLREPSTTEAFWTCGENQFKGEQVAILSSTSATSMGVG